MTDPITLQTFTQKVITLAEAENVSLSDLIRSLQQRTVTTQTGCLPVIRRSSVDSSSHPEIAKRKGPATFEDFYLYIQGVNSNLDLHELTEIKRRNDREFPKHFFRISDDKTTVGLARQDDALTSPATYAVFTFDPETHLVILSRVLDGVPEQSFSPYKVSFDTLIGGNTTSWQYVFNYQGMEIKETLSKLLNM